MTTTPISALNVLRNALRNATQPPASASFHASSATLESRVKIIARRKKARVLAQRQEIVNAQESRKPDPVLGYYIPSTSSAGPSRRAAAAAESSETIWDQSLLKQTVLNPNDIWYSPPPNYAAGETPGHLLPGMGATADRDFLFKSLPAVTTAITYDDAQAAATQQEKLEEVERAQIAQTETMMRMLDLRNASKAGIQMVNRERIVEAFGRDIKGKGTDTGSSEVQAAILTARIRNLHDHLQGNKRDVHNKRALRTLVHKRARVLSYFRRKDEVGYVELLGKLGLERQAVEGEVIVR